MDIKDVDCESTQARMPDWLSGQLTEAEHSRMAAHLEQCPACREELAAFGQLWQAMGSISAPEPSEQVRPRFYAMLAEFEAESQRQPWSAKLRQFWQLLVAPSPALRLAYSALLLVGGLAIGYALNNRPGPQDTSGPVTANASSDNQQRLVLNMLENPSATQRLRAVSQTREIAQVNKEVVGALLSTLNNDPNVNVRLATLDALAQLGQDPTVRQGLVHSLTMQESPLVQSALADVMVQLQVRRSVKPLRQLLRQADLNEAVKSKIENSIQTLSNGRPADPSSPKSSHENRNQPATDPTDTVSA